MKFRVEGIYDAKKLGIPQMLILGLQHMFAMFGATILVPILVNNYFHGEGLSIQVALFCAGFGTLLFHVLTKLKVPDLLQLQSLIPEFSQTCPMERSFHTHAAVYL